VTGNGTLGPYSLVDASSVAIRLVSTGHLKLTRYAASTDTNSSGTLLVLNTDYTVGGTQDARTFTLIGSQAVLTSSQRIVAERVQNYTQDLDLTTGGSFNSSSLESRFDKLAEFQQELKARLDRVPALQFADATANVAFPSPPTSATQFLARNTAGEITYATAADLTVDVTLGSGWAAALSAALGALWSSAFVASTAHGICKALGLPMPVANLVALQALGLDSPSASIPYILMCRTTAGDRGGGRFRWSASDNSANVTNDPLTAFYVPGTALTGSAGAFIREDDSDGVIAEWGGAKSGDAAVDCSPIATALETLAHQLNRRLVKWPGRAYYWNTPFAGIRSSITHQGTGVTQWIGTHATSDIIRCGSPSAYVVDRTYDGIVPVMTGGGSHYFFRQVNCRGSHYRNMMNNSIGTNVRNGFALGLPATAITNVVNNGSGKARVTSTAHGLGTGVYVRVNGVEGTTEVNVFSYITVIDADTFDMTNVNFVNAFVLGAALGRVAPHVYRTVFDNINVYCADQFGLRIFNHAGDIHHYGEFWLEGAAEVPAAGTKGISVARNTNSYDRIDHWVGHTTVAAHRFATAFEIDNTRVVGIEWGHFHCDDTITCGIDIKHDNNDWTVGGMEACNFLDVRKGGPPTTGHPILRVTATDTEVVSGTFNVHGTMGNADAVQFIGRTSGATVFNSISQIKVSAEISASPTSGNYDVMTFSGGCYGVVVENVGGITATAFTRYGVNIAANVPAGEITVLAVPFEGLSSAKVNDLSGRQLVQTAPSIGGVRAADVASATTVTLRNVRGDYVHITGTTTITGFSTDRPGRVIETIFDGVLQLTNSANLINKGGANVTTAAGDVARWRCEDGTIWRMTDYMRAAGAP
jgi:hypothetical protein